MSLATENRPKTFDQVLGHESTIKILKRQLETKSYANCYLFCGPTGVGKTTLARIFANEINANNGSPIEIDAASNNGVDNVRDIIEHANERSLNSEYKIYIIDECHMISTAGWNAFLKCIEEPPKYTIFIFCTTDPQKIPATINNRLMRFNLGRISNNAIYNKLLEITYNGSNLDQTDYENILNYIIKISDGSVRNALAYLEKLLSYGDIVNLSTALDILDGYQYNLLFKLINAITDYDVATIINLTEEFYTNGKDLRLLIEQLIDLSLNLCKYCVFKNINLTNIPSTLEEEVKYTVGVFETQDQNIKYFNKLSNALMQIKFDTRYDTNLKTTLEVMLININNGNLSN